MSVILDALKKLDREKKSRRKRTSSLAAEILRPDAPDRRKTLLLYLGVALLTAIITATLTYSLRREAPLREIPVASPAAPSSSDQQVSPSPPAEPVLEIHNWRKETPAVSRDRDDEKRASRKPVRAEAKKEEGVPSREVAVPLEPKVLEPPSAIQLSLKLSVIAWSENPSNRIAVVNEQVLGEGAEIKGVKVVEIGTTSVRFFHKGKSFEIPLGSSVSLTP